ncbi:MAG TPA: hypothetical protein VGI99_09205, partial [Gemmataceae bacterium]
MALPPFSFTSFSPVPPPPPPSEAPKQPEPRPEAVPMTAQQPIVPPTEAPAAIPEVSAAPPLQSVTVVVSPRSEEPKPGHLKQWTSLGAILGLAIGLAAAWMYHSKLPGVFESRARLQVTGPSPAGDAETQIAILRSRSVEDRAARKLDDYRPYEMPPPKADAARVAFLERGLSIVPELSSGPGSTLSVAFRGPHRADTPKYLRAIVDAYKEELASRSPKATSPEPEPAPPPKVSQPPKSSPQNSASSERAKLQKELDALIHDEPAAIESRLTADRAAASEAQAKLRAIDRDLALIRATGKSRRDRLATMEELGIEADSPRTVPGAAADLKTAEDSLKALQAKKAELGQRLGPEHRDMVALDEQIKLARERIAKAMPKAPTGPDELDRYRAKLETERTAIASRAAALATKIATDERLLADVSRLPKRIDAIAVAAPKPNAPAPSQEAATSTEPPSPTSFAVQAAIPTTEGERISPELYRSLVPGGALGLLGGAGLGLLGGLIVTGRRSSDRKRPSPRTPIMTTVVRPTAPAVAITSGPRLSIPVFANVPALRGDSPPEKRSGEGWSPLLVAFSRPSSPEAELFRSARRELMHALRNRGHQVVPITSPGAGDGKSLVAANLAISLAQSGKRVILVDCNLSAPKMQELFRLTRLGDSLKSIMAAEV